MPLTTTFYGMVKKGFSMVDILLEINGKLKSMLPVGLFCCATMVEMNFYKKTVRVWNGGLPAAYIYRKNGKTEAIKSTHLPLGVLGNQDFKADPVLLRLEDGERLYLWSDGIHETRNSAGEMFGEERLGAVFAQNTQREKLFDELLMAVKTFAGDMEKSDDLSLVELLMGPADAQSRPQYATARGRSQLAEWSLAFEVKPSSFAMFDPLPLLLGVMLEVPGLRQHTGTLYTVLSELYANALEHGLLGLDSQLKTTPDGFDHYYALREKRLQEVTDGFIRIELKHSTTAEGGCLDIVVADSGAGFSAKDMTQGRGATDYSGRGLMLVASLCDTLEVQPPGNIVKAVYRWRSDE